MKGTLGRYGALVGAMGSALLLGPPSAAPCPVCFAAGSNRLLDSFLLSTVVLTLLPFALLAAIFAVGMHLQSAGRNLERRSDAPDAMAPRSASSPGPR